MPGLSLLHSRSHFLKWEGRFKEFELSIVLFPGVFSWELFSGSFFLELFSGAFFWERRRLGAVEKPNWERRRLGAVEKAPNPSFRARR